MAFALKAKRELEMKAHDQFYKNVHILTVIYPPTEEFTALFKRDMFVKNNKAGFHHVVYYLFGILNTFELKHKIKVWPVIDMRREIEFRTEVLRCVNELNTIYEYANIPQLATSHLISPGGFKFVKFMLSLSQLVVFQHLKHSPTSAKSMLYPLKPSKQNNVTSENIDNLNKITQQINAATSKMRNNFEVQFNDAKLEAQDIDNTRQRVKKSIKEKQIVLIELKKEPTDDPAKCNEGIKEKLERLTAIEKKFKRCELLSSYLKSDSSKLEHNSNSKIPTEIAHMIRYEDDNVDLYSFIEGFNAFIDHKRLELRLVTDEEIQQHIERFRKMNDRLSMIDVGFNEVNRELLEGKEQLEIEESSTTLNKTETQLESSCGFSDSNLTPLALPLSPSLTDFEDKLGLHF